ncbi:MAG: isocitrate lyase/PEP mutase family protein [Acidimicrobiales bacterium]
MTLAEKAERLLAAHHGESPLLLANVWDAASARSVEAAGFDFVATSSRAVAQVLGEADDDSSDPDLVLSFTERIARAVSVPVTADLEAGLGLAPTELVERMLRAGVVGCNLEDTNHHGGGGLVDADRQAAYLAELRAAAERQGVHVVLNARTDPFLGRAGQESGPLEEAVRRGQLYFQAGADCVYPMAVARQEDVAALVEALPGPLNFLARRGGLSIAELTALGARRISLASGVFQLIADRLGEVATALAGGAGLDDL